MPDLDEDGAERGAPPFARAEALHPGARVWLVAPSGTFDVERFERGRARLAERYDVVVDDGILARAGYLAGSDERRARELLAALEDPLCQAIVCARGGYGAMRLLPRLPLRQIARASKLLVGFSDVTALHVAWQRARVASLHGAMVASLGALDEARFSRWIRALEGAPLPPIDGLEVLTPGEARGVLVGGNLSILHALEGTPYAASTTNRVLFLEDVGEAPYRVDRMLTTLLLSGFFQGVRAIVLGAFTKSDPGSHGVEVLDVLRERLAPLEIPIVRGVPSGHVEDNLELPFGVEVRVEASPTDARLTFLGSLVRARD